MTEDKFRSKVDTGKRLAQLRGDGTDAGTGDDGPELLEAEEVVEAFSTLSADRAHKLMLELRFKTGNAKALAYSYLVSADFDPSSGIALDFSAYVVRLAGRHLAPVFSGIVAQRVAVIQETDELQAEATHAAQATVVTSIEVTGKE